MQVSDGVGDFAILLDQHASEMSFFTCDVRLHLRGGASLFTGTFVRKEHKCIDKRMSAALSDD